MKAAFAVSGVIALSLAACTAQPAAPPKPDEAAIRAGLGTQLERIGTMLSHKDTTVIAQLFAPDATWILPDASTYHGRAAITAGAKAFFAAFDSVRLSPAVIDKLVIVSDSEVVTFAHGDYTMFVKGKSSGARVNPYADLWRKGADGTWLIAYEVNADGAAPGAAAPARH